MALFIFIDGLLAAGDPPMEQVCPGVDRMAAHGETGRAFLADGDRPPEEGGAWFSYFGHPQPTLEWDLPTGFFAALGAGLSPEPRKTWAMLSFTNLYRKQDKLLILSPQRTGQTAEECRSLAHGLREEFAAEGWGIQCPDHGTVMFCHGEQRLKVRTTPLEILEGEDSLASLPRGEHYRHLHQLLTSGQLLIARHEVNTARRQAGRLPLNTPWFQGVGSGPDMMALGRKHGRCWTQELLVAGLARAAGLQVTLMDEGEAMPHFSLQEVADQATSGTALLHLHGPAILARHKMMAERLALLASMDETILRPLAGELAARQTGLTLLTPYPLAANGLGSHAPACWLTVEGKSMVKDRRFWNRRRFGEGDLLDIGALTERWS